ncbi:AT-rich interactive domain-containing protein 1A-like isoform X3 [Ciona intestinalis]
MLSPNRNTPQPTHHPHDPASGGTVPSPQVHPPHPSVAQLRGPSAPGSPASVGNPRSNPMSPPMKPGTPQQNRPSSEHLDQNLPSHSPMPGYGHYRPQTSQSSYGPPNPVPPNYPQHMVSPQQYPGGQQYPTTPQHPHAPQMRPAGPPSGGKPGQMMSPHGYTQAQQSPVYQGVPYYEGSHQHTAQAGYNTSSPAPSERRPSRQGSHPSAQQTDQGGRQGAAAAAAAAMVAAAHSAQPMTQPAPRNPTPTYYPPGAPTSQPQQAPRPHYNLQQGGEMYQQSMGFPRMPHPGVQGSSPAQGIMGPPGPPQATQRMPASSTPYGYPLQPSHPQYPGYYPPNSGESHPAPHGYNPPQNNYETPPPPPVEETPKPKSSARSASQKLAALFEPSDEPGRRDFIDSVLRYWEDKDLPLKNAPLMGRKTLDLFHLYHKVKDRGGMQEVTSGKKWAEISTEMGLGTSSTSGFTLKKQYCKYLYGYECRVERGQEEPHEAMARILEANRKRKVQVDQQNAKEEAAKSTPSPQVNPPAAPGPPAPQHHPPPPQPRYPSQQYPPGQYPNQMGYPPPQGYMQQHPSAPPYQYPPHQMPPPTNTPMMQGYPPMQPPVSSYPPASSYPPTAPISTPPQPPQPPTKEKPPQTKPGSEPPTPPTTAPSQTPEAPKVAQSVLTKPPIDPNSAPPYNDAPKTPQPPNSMPQQQYRPTYPTGPHQQYPHHPPRPHMPQQELYRPGPRPGIPPTNYPYSNSPSLHRPGSVPTQPGASPYHPQAPSPRNSPYPNTMGQPPSARPTYPNQGYPGHPYTPPGQYLGMKRPATDQYGPPSKYIRPEGHPSHYPTPGNYPPNHPAYDRTRPRYPSSGPSTPHGSHPMYRGPLRRDRGSHPSGGFPKHDGARWPHPGVTQQAQSPVQFQHIHKYSMEQRKRQVYRSSMLRSDNLFPPDSVEATQPKNLRFQRKSCRDVGVLEGWKVIMALKSGLLVESTWALNVLTVLLYDQQTIAQFKLVQLPGLLDALVEHYRRCLSAIFTLSSEQQALGVTNFDPTPHPEVKDVLEDETSDLPTKMKTNKGKKKKGQANAKLYGVFSKLPIKVEPRTDPFVVDRTHQWDFANKIDLSDDLSHIIVSFEQSTETTQVEQDEITEAEQPIRVVEATLEDVLSIPCSVLAPEDDDDVIDDVTTHDVMTDDVIKDIKKEVVEKSEDIPKTKTHDEINVANGTDENERMDVCDVIKKTDDVIINPDVTKNDDVIKKCDDVTIKNNDVIMKTDDITNHTADITNNTDDIIKKTDDITNHTAHITNNTDDIIKKVPDVINKLNDVTNEQSDVIMAEVLTKESEKLIKEEKVEVVLKENLVLCNGLQTSLMLNQAEVKVEQVTTDSSKLKDSPRLSLTSRVEKVLEERNVILLEDEAAGSDGSRVDLLLGPVIHQDVCKRQAEVSRRLECLSNIIRGLSFVPGNANELCRQRELMRALSGTLLLRHKHRTRPRHASPHSESCDENGEKSDNCSYYLNSIGLSGKKSKKSDLFAPDDKIEGRRQRRLFSATVLDSDENTEVYTAPWWWDTVRRVREDSLVIFSNIAHSVDLSELPDDHVAMAMLEACLHWSVCPSSDASDSFSSSRSRRMLSPQRLALEILTKLSIKDQNVDLILATRPFSRIEKLFGYLVNLICDRKDQTLREFAIVLIANLAGGDTVAARAIALQKGAISGLISFLEECEETGMSNRRMFSAVQQNINCGTIEFMMIKCSTTILCLAKLDENRSSFVKYQLRLLSLSMSQILDPKVIRIMSSVLYELSHDSS